jgi:hypothetical protein
MSLVLIYSMSMMEGVARFVVDEMAVDLNDPSKGAFLDTERSERITACSTPARLKTTKDYEVGFFRFFFDCACLQ